MSTPLPSQSLTASQLPLGASHLVDWGLIRAAGPEAAKFLQGQLTQDVELMKPGEGRLSGFCTAKGRLMATFVMWRDGAEDVLLACSADLLPAVLKRLSMFVLRAKCKLTDASAERPLWGLAGANLLPGLPAAPWQRADMTAATVIRLPDGVAAGTAVPRWLCWGEPGVALPSLDHSDWLGLEASSGVARVMAATVEQFVPQMVNLELVGGVSFKKGCYPGQEIVARSQYRGTLKRRAQVVQSAVALQPGQEIFHDADPGQPAGMVILAGTQPADLHVALVEIKLAALMGGTLHAGDAQGPALLLLPLPYAMALEDN